MASPFIHKLPQSEGQVRSALGIPLHVHYHGDMEGSGIDWVGIGRSIAHSLNIPTDNAGGKNLAKKIVSVGMPSAGAALLGGLGSLAGPLTEMAGSTVRGVAGRIGAEKVNEQIGSGIRKRGRPRKVVM